MSYKVDHPTKVTFRPTAQCNDCGWGRQFLSDARASAKRHVADTGHSVIVDVVERTLYSPADGLQPPDDRLDSDYNAPNSDSLMEQP